MRTIFMLDDDADESMIVQSALEELGENVQLRWFYNFEDLCKSLEASKALPNMLLLDINLPGETGIECLRELKNHATFRTIPVIMYTNSDYKENIRQCFKLGATAYVKKSSSFELLKKHLHVVLNWDLATMHALPEENRTLIN